MSVVDKMFGQKSGETENPKSDNNTTSSEETKTPTLEEVITSTGQDDRTDESKKDDKKSEDGSKDKLIVSLKRDLKKQGKEMSELRGIVSDLMNVLETDKKSKLSEAKIKAFAEKRGVNPEDIRDLAELLRDEVAPQDSTKRESQGSKVSEDEDEDDDEEEETIEENVGKKFDIKRLSTAVDTMLADFLEDMPEYAEVVDEETIKELILAKPAKYAKLNMSQIVEKVYGRTIQGKKGVERLSNSSRERGAKTKGNLTKKEFDQIKDDPEALKEYRRSILDRASQYGI